MRLAAIATRLVGLWVLLGAVLKLLYGSPADLPDVLRGLSLDPGVLFRVAVAAELVIGAFALARPSRGWLPLLLLVLAFVAVLITQVAAGDEACGCFGAALVIAPTVMLAVDGALALLLLATRPWRLVPEVGELPASVAAVLALCLVALPLVIDREARPGQADGGGLRPFANLRLDTMQGRRLGETRLHAWLDEDQRIEDGLIVIWRASCEICAEHLDNLHVREQGDRDVVLLELPKEFDDEKDVVGRKPEGAFVHVSRLPETVIWDLTPPVHIEVEAGTVTKVLEGLDVLD